MTDRLAPHRARVNAEDLWALAGDERTAALIAAGVAAADLPALEAYCDSRSREEAGLTREPGTDVDHARPEFLTAGELEHGDRARAALEFRRGLEEGGVTDSAHRIGYLADAVLELLESLRSARSLQRALDQRIDRQERIIVGRQNTGGGSGA